MLAAGPRTTWFGSHRRGPEIVAFAIAVAAFWWIVLADFSWWFHNFVRPPVPADFQLSFDAARIGLTSGWSHIYDLGLQRIEFYRIRPLRDVFDVQVYYVAAPPVAWLLAPLAALPYALAYWLYLGVMTAAYVVTAWFATPGRAVGRVAVVLGGATTYPVLICLAMGQVALAVVIAVVVAWALLRQGHQVAAGLAMAAIFLKPQVAYLVPVALLLWGAWRATAVAAIAGVLLLGASVLSLGTVGVAEWLHDLSLESHNIDNQIWTVALFTGPGYVAFAVEAACGLTALAISFLARSQKDPGVAVTAGLVGSLLAAPYHHGADSIALVAACWIGLTMQPSRAMALWMGLGAVAAFFEPPTGPAPLLVFAAGFLILLLHRQVKDRAASSGRQPILAGKEASLTARV